MCLIWKTITHIIRKLKQLKIQQMIEGLPKDAGLRSVETSAWEWGPKVRKKSMTVSNTSSFCLFPWHLLQRPTEGKVIPCQGCVAWVLMQRAFLCQVWEFSTTLLTLSWLVFCSSRLPVCVHPYAFTAYLKHNHLFPRYVQGSSCIRLPAAELDWWPPWIQSPWLKQEVLLSERSMVRVARKTKGTDFHVLASPRGRMHCSQHCRAANMTVETYAVFWEQNVPVCLARDPSCHDLAFSSQLRL